MSATCPPNETTPDLPASAKLHLLVSRLEERIPALRRARTAFIAAIASRPWTPGELRPWRAVARALAEPRALCPAAYAVAAAELEVLRLMDPAARRTRLRRRQRQSLNPALAEALLAEAIRVRSKDPRAAVAWIDDALGVADLLWANGLSRSDLAPLRLRLLAHRANALRVACELPAADRAFAEIANHPGLEHMDRLEDFAELASLEASLRTDQRRFTDAVGLLEWAEAAYRLIADKRELARIVMKRGHTVFVAGDPEVALTHHTSAFAYLDSLAEPALSRRIVHNIALCLVELGRPEKAMAQLLRHRRLFEREVGRADAIRHSWLAGLISSALGRACEAEESLAGARDAYLDLDLAYDAALVCLDLADLYLGQGRTREVRELASAMVPIFESQDVHCEALAALMLFREAALAEALTGELVGALRRYLRQARRDPSFRFEPDRMSASS